MIKTKLNIICGSKNKGFGTDCDCQILPCSYKQPIIGYGTPTKANWRTEVKGCGFWATHEPKQPQFQLPPSSGGLARRMGILEDSKGQGNQRGHGGKPLARSTTQIMRSTRPHQLVRAGCRLPPFVANKLAKIPTFRFNITPSKM